MRNDDTPPAARVRGRRGAAGRLGKPTQAIEQSVVMPTRRAEDMTNNELAAIASGPGTLHSNDGGPAGPPSIERNEIDGQIAALKIFWSTCSRSGSKGLKVRSPNAPPTGGAP